MVKPCRGIKELKLAAADVNNEVPSYQLGLILVKDRRYKEAVRYLRVAVKINPLLADAHYYLGYSHEQLGEADAARAEYGEALKYVPDYADAKRGLERLTR